MGAAVPSPAAVVAHSAVAPAEAWSPVPCDRHQDHHSQHRGLMNARAVEMTSILSVPTINVGVARLHVTALPLTKK